VQNLGGKQTTAGSRSSESPMFVYSGSEWCASGHRLYRRCLWEDVFVLVIGVG